ncbi:zinc-ribbon domain-containing protein [Bremerella sp. T1]|uniref:zinc-ribbon domain-containing protein n=1 Tax=Bremerella sp. TYQ1 TaxID=3119568 RepID=UPI001CCCA045|nr:zinc-ribbon domain-containing protein [Bremerella volcania]UBM36852.1 zinc-ribbon domain-containing protein [Bremerella volcania]
MSKLFIVCPSCQTKYPVADQKLAGKKVTCKKCSEKFVAKIMAATPKKAAKPATSPAPAPADDPFNDPLGDDLFADMQASSSEGPALSSLPPKKRTKSSGSFPIVPVVLGGVGLLVVGILVITVVSLASNGLGDLGGSGGGFASNSVDESAVQQHRDIAMKQHNSTIKFIEAIEAIQGDGDLPGFKQKIEGLTREMESLAESVKTVPAIPEERVQEINKENKQRLLKLEGRMRAAGEKLRQFNKPDVMSTVVKYQGSLGKVIAALNSVHVNAQKENELLQNVSYETKNKPGDSPEMLFKYVLDDYEIINLLLSKLSDRSKQESRLRQIQSLQANIKACAEQLRDTSVFLSEDLAPAISEYGSKTQQADNQTRSTLNRVANEGLSGTSAQLAKSAQQQANEINSLWKVINGPRPVRVDGDLIGPSAFCFSAQESETFLKRFEQFKQSTNDDRPVVLFVDRRMEKQIEEWKSSRRETNYETFDTQLMIILFKHFDRGDRWFGPGVEFKEVADVNVVIIPYDPNAGSTSPAESTPSRPSGPPIPRPGMTGPPGFPPGGPGRGMPQRPRFDEMPAKMIAEFGAENVVRIETPRISPEESKKYREVITPWMTKNTHVSWYNSSVGVQVMQFPYDGDVLELSEKITFGEVEEVLVDERLIRLKSISFP